MRSRGDRRLEENVCCGLARRHQDVCMSPRTTPRISTEISDCDVKGGIGASSPSRLRRRHSLEGAVRPAGAGFSLEEDTHKVPSNAGYSDTRIAGGPTCTH